MASTKTISNTFSVSALENAFAVDLSNEMDSIACTNSMRVISASNIYSMISAFDGVSENTSTCKVRYVSRPSNCTTFLESSDSGTNGTELTTSFKTIGSNRYIRIHFNRGVSVNRKETLKIEVTHDGLGTLALDINISATKGGAIYNVVPSATTISKNPNGTVSYSPSSISAYVTKHDIESGTTSDNPSEATLKYSADGGTIQNYSSALTPGTHFSSYVTFYVQVGGAYVDKETVSVVLEGKNGADSTVPGPEGYGVKLTLKRDDKYSEYTWNRYGTIGLSTPWGKADGDSDFTACRVGDYFIVTGKSTDKGIRHTIESRCTSVSADSITGSCVSHIKDGQEGSRGRVGRFFYYVGTWTGDTVKTYTVNDAQAPYFKYGNNYYVFNPETNGDYTESQMGTPSTSSTNWEIMTNDFKYIITEALFGSFAHLGSFIINEDWLISQHGTVNGNSSDAYTQFDKDYPNTNHYDSSTGQYNFIPNFAVDGLTGETYQNVAHVRGEIHATSGEFDGAFMSVDRKVAICGTPITTSSYWRGLAVGINPDDYDPYSQWGSSSDLITAGARFNSDSSQGYGRIVTTRNGSDNMVLITSAPEGSDGGGRVAIRGGDGSVTCEKMNVSGAASITGSLSVSGSLKTGSGTVSLPSDPNTGTIVFVKGTTGDVTSVSGNGKKIMESNSNTESSTRANLGKNSAFYIFDGTRWIEFFCG